MDLVPSPVQRRDGERRLMDPHPKHSVLSERPRRRRHRMRALYKTVDVLLPSDRGWEGDPQAVCVV